MPNTDFEANKAPPESRFAKTDVDSSNDSSTQKGPRGAGFRNDDQRDMPERIARAGDQRPATAVRRSSHSSSRDLRESATNSHQAKHQTDHGLPGTEAADRDLAGTTNLQRTEDSVRAAPRPLHDPKTVSTPHVQHAAAHQPLEVVEGPFKLQVGTTDEPVHQPVETSSSPVRSSMTAHETSHSINSTRELKDSRQFDNEKIAIENGDEFGNHGQKMLSDDAIDGVIQPMRAGQTGESAATTGATRLTTAPAAQAVRRPDLAATPSPSNAYGALRHSYDVAAQPASARRSSESRSQQYHNAHRYGDAEHGLRSPSVSSFGAAASMRDDRKLSTETTRPPVPPVPLEPPPPLVRNQSDWSSSSLAMAPDALHQIPTLNRPSSILKPQMSNVQALPSQSTSNDQKQDDLQHQHSLLPPATIPQSVSLPTFNQIDSNKRHYARGNTEESEQRPIGLDADTEKPPLPPKSRNRLSKRHSSYATPQVKAPDSQPPEKEKKKRSSMLGTILRRSETSKGENEVKPPSNKLRKTNSRKLTGEQAASAMPPPPPTPSLPHPPTAIPSLPNLDTNFSTAGQREPDATSGAESKQSSALQEYAGYYSPGLGQTPTFETPSQRVQLPSDKSARDRGRAQHISYLQSQDMFPSRQPASPTNPLTESPLESSPISAQAYQDGMPQRVPSDASSVYTRVDDHLSGNQSNASSHYGQAGEFAAQRRTRPLTQAYAQFSRGPYGDQAFEQQPPPRRQSMPLGNHGYNPNVYNSNNYSDYTPVPMPQAGLAQMYADARRPNRPVGAAVGRMSAGQEWAPGTRGY